MCQLLTPTARPARPSAPVVGDSLRPPGRLGDGLESCLALLDAQGDGCSAEFWPVPCLAAPGPRKPGRSRSSRLRPSAPPSAFISCAWDSKNPDVVRIQRMPRPARWNSNLERDRTPFPANSVFASVSGTNRLRGLAPTNAVTLWINCWRRGNARRSNNATSSSRAPRTTSTRLVGFLPCADAQNVI